MEMNEMETKWVHIVSELLHEAAFKVYRISRTYTGIQIYISHQFWINFHRFDDPAKAWLGIAFPGKITSVNSGSPVEDLRDWIWRESYLLVRKYIVLPHRLDLRIQVELRRDNIDPFPPKIELRIDVYGTTSSNPEWEMVFYDQQSIAMARGYILGYTPEEVFWEYLCEQNETLDREVNHGELT